MADIETLTVNYDGGLSARSSFNVGDGGHVMARVLGLGLVEVEGEGVVALLLDPDAALVGTPLLAVLRP